MSARRPLLALVLLLAGCHRGNVADVTLDADRAAENATAAKTIADLAAADEAAQGPAPIIGTPPRRTEKAAEPARAAEDDTAPADDETLPEGNAADAQPQ